MQQQNFYDSTNRFFISITICKSEHILQLWVSTEVDEWDKIHFIDSHGRERLIRDWANVSSEKILKSIQRAFLNSIIIGLESLLVAKYIRPTLVHMLNVSSIIVSSFIFILKSQ